MEPRLKYPKVLPGPYAAMLKLDESVRAGGMEPALMELVRLRVSQINGCAYCIDMHWKDARAAGESEQRLYGLSSWRESPYYTERERAALDWAEAVTNLHEGHASDAAYDAARLFLGEQEIVQLTWLAAAMSTWNRMAIGMRAVPGRYTPKTPTPTKAPPTAAVASAENRQ